MKTRIKKILIAGVFSATAFAAVSAPASAGKLSLGFNSFHKPHFSFIDTHACSHYYSRWQTTGRFHWKRKYFRCMGWW